MSEEDGQNSLTKEILVDALEKAYRAIMKSNIEPEKILYSKDSFINVYSYYANIPIEKAREMVELEIYKRTKLGITDMWKSIVFLVPIDDEETIKKREDEKLLYLLGLKNK